MVLVWCDFAGHGHPQTIKVHCNHICCNTVITGNKHEYFQCELGGHNNLGNKSINTGIGEQYFCCCFMSVNKAFRLCFVRFTRNKAQAKHDAH